MKKIITFTFNDLSISYGPSVHYLELWNEYYKHFSNHVEVIGYYPNWSKGNPIVDPLFSLKKISVPNIPLIRQVFIDIYFAFVLLIHRNDTIYIRLSNYSFFLVLILKFLRIRPYIELNGIINKDHQSSKKNSLYKVLSNWQEVSLIKQAKGCIAVSEGIEEYALKVGCKNTITLKNGISSDFFKINQKKSFTNDIVYVGTFTSWDGADKIIDLAKEFPSIRFHMVGDGPARKKIESLSSENIIFYGYKKYQELKLLYCNFDAGIVLYPMARNDMKLSSLKTLEYVASGLPVFTTNVPGQEFISENGIGICTTEEDLIKNFQYFITHIESFKKSNNEYRAKSQSEIGWSNVAVLTAHFIDHSELKSR